jgi:hypothetical protein
MEHLGVRSRRELAARLVRKSVQAAFTQTAIRVAPGLVGSCPACARVVVRLRPAGSRLCEHCARAAI